MGVFTDITMDFIEGLSKSQERSIIFVVVDQLTKFSHFIGLKHHFSIVTVAQVFMDNIYRLRGLPNTITSDREPTLINQFW